MPGAVEETKKPKTGLLLSGSSQCGWSDLSINSANTGELTPCQELYRLQGMLRFIYLFNKHLLNTYYVPETVLGAGNPTENKQV